MEKLEGYKTLTFNTLKVVFGALIAAGIMDMDQQQAILEHLDGIIGGFLVIEGIVSVILRKLTTSPMGKLFQS